MGLRKQLLAAIAGQNIMNLGSNVPRLFRNSPPIPAVRAAAAWPCLLLRTLLNRLSARLVFALACACWTTWSVPAALACDRCVAFGTTAFHEEFRLFAGGDSFDDTLAPAEPLDEGMASAAFVLQGGKFSQPNGLGSPITVTYSFNNLLDGGLKDISGDPLPVPLIRKSVEEALGAWSAHAPLHFVEVADEGGGPFLNNYPNGQFGQIRFSHVFINGPDIPNQLPIAKAMARFPSSGGNIASDVFFDNGDPWQEIGSLSQPDILGAAIHEIGHTLGIGHTDDSTANMYWIFHRFSGLGTGQLFDDDINGIQAIYGEGLGSVTPLPVPEPGMAAISVWLVAFLLRRGRRGPRRQVRG
jgi:hypothetical protein